LDSLLLSMLDRAFKESCDNGEGKMKSKSKKISQSSQIKFENIIMHGGYFFPVELGKFFIELAQPKSSEKILRIGFNEPSLGFPNESEFFPQDISSEMLIAERQKLLDREKFDVILCAPSFGVPSGENKQPSEEMWIEWGIKHLKNGGRFVIIVPIGLLSNYSQIPIRQFIIEHSRLEAIIELSSGWTPSTTILASILYITAGMNENQSVKMFQLSQTHNLSFTDLAKEIRGTASKLLDSADGKVFTVSSSEIDQSRLDIKYYDPVYRSVSPGPDYESVKLSDLVMIRSGNRFMPGDFDSIGIPFIQVRNLTTTGEFDLRNAKKIKVDIAINNRSYCEIDDILISTAGTIGKTVVVPPGINVCIDTSLRQLRIRDKSKLLPEYLALFLRSASARLQMRRMSSGSVIHVLSNPNLENLIVYLPTISKQRDIVASFSQKIQEVQSQMLALFPVINKYLGNRSEIAHVASEQNIKQVTSSETEEELLRPTILPKTHSKKENLLGSIVPNKFPYPLARAYSLFINSFNDSDSKQVQRLFLASEAIVYYLYGILVSDYTKRYSTNDLELDTLLINSIYDFSIDRKVKFISKLIKKSRANDAWNLFVPEIADVTIGICSEINNHVRNKYSHDESPEAWCKKQVKEYSPKLEKLFKSLFPLQAYRLVQVRSILIREGRLQHNMISMMGNNSIFTPQIEDLDNVLQAETNHVILLDQDYNALDLHPFYQFHAWESTGMQDRLCFAKQVNQEKNTLKLENLEGSGTTEIDVDIKFSDILNQLKADGK